MDMETGAGDERAPVRHPIRVGVLAGLIVVALGMLLFGVVMALGYLFGSVITIGFYLSVIGLLILWSRSRGRRPSVR